MTQEEKAKAYDEAIKVARPLYERAKKDDCPIWSTYETIFPEFAESEDERIRKEIVECIETLIKQPGASPRLCDWLAWLEKQKDEDGYEAIPVENTLEYKLGFKAGKEAEKQKEQKPYEPHNWPSDKDNLVQKPVVTGNDYGWIDDLKHDLEHPEELDKKVEEALKQRQKPADEVEIPTNLDLEKEFQEFCKDYPFPWSSAYVNEEYIKELCMGVARHFYELGRNSKPAEWSDEDEDRLELLMEVIKFYEVKCKVYLFELKEFLKSLRPRYKSELAIGFMNYLDNHRPEGKMCLSNAECEDIDKAFKNCDWDKIMRYVKKYNSHWKPSEEQMEALKEDIDFAPDYYKLRCTLVSLYNDLKKLKED